MNIIIHNIADSLKIHDDGIVIFSSARPMVQGSPCWSFRDCKDKCIDLIKTAGNGDVIKISCARQSDRYRVHHVDDTVLLYNISEYDALVHGFSKQSQMINLLSIGVVQYHHNSKTVTMSNSLGADIFQQIESIDTIRGFIHVGGKSYRVKSNPIIVLGEIPLITQYEFIPYDSFIQKGFMTDISNRKILSNQQLVAYKCFLIGMSQPEAARIMGIERNTYSEHLSAAVRKIKEEMSEFSDIIMLQESQETYKPDIK